MSLLRLVVKLLEPPSLGFGGGGSPAPPPPPTAAQSRALIPPMLQSPQGADAVAAVRRKAASGRGYGGTIVTGPQGLTAPATTQQNTLLGG
jgi:hypothetical protein